MTGFQHYTLTGQPDLLALHRAAPERYPHLLASTASGGPLAHFSLLFFALPQRLVLHADGVVAGPHADTGFLASLSRWYQHECDPLQRPHALWPFIGGWFVYLGYELAGEIEPGLDLPAFEPAFPTAFAQRCPAAIIVNHVTGQSFVIAETAAQLETILADLARLEPTPVMLADAAARLCQLQLTADDPAHFVDGIGKTKEYILAGDVFQVNLSRAWHGRAECELDAATIYQRLGRNNAAPFAGICRYADAAVISSSPERLVETRGRAVQTRPIAGTRPRSRQQAQDRALSRELIGHPKERAEHIMLIDLERNDLGRVCEPGSVEVNELMVVESYAHVHHIVSNVRGRLRAAANPVDVIAALFPGGTITGCPKVRCMEIIAELEKVGRGFYTGSMGYLSRDGTMDLNILIRSMYVQGRSLHFRTGAGIVADSIAEREVGETEAKARGLLLALGAEHV